MNEKINWADLRKAVVNRSNAPEKDVTLFLNALTQAVKEGLKEDGMVRMNGLGTFSVKAVAERKSVDVNTGNEIVIPGYNKVSFAPEAAMKDITDHISPNAEAPKPTAVSEKVDEAEDPMKKIGEQATEILGILAELHEMDKEGQEEPEVPEVQEVQEEAEEPVEPEETETPEITETEEATEEEEEEPEETPEDPVEPVEPVETVEPEEPTEDELGDTTRPWMIASLCLLVLAIAMAILFLTRGAAIRQWLYSPRSEQVERPTTPARTAEPKNTAPAEKVEVVTPTKEVQKAGLPRRVYTEWKDTVQLNPGSRLTLLAQRNYGVKDLWVFIYEANQDRLPSPNHIQIGESIYIPKLAPEWCDLSNEQVVATIDSLKNVYKDK